MKVEIRDNSVVLDGYVNVVQRDSRVLPSARGKFVEQIEPRAFERALSRTDSVDLLFNHKQERKLGSTAEGNLELREDSIGLRAICTVTDEEVVNKAKNGELRGWSFGFICREDRWVDGEEIQRRFVDELDLLEVSILDVTPAYVATSIESRGEETVVTEQRFEESEMSIGQADEMNQTQSCDCGSPECSDCSESVVVSQATTTTTTTETVINDGGQIVIETVTETTTETPDYSFYEMEIEILKIKGGLQ